MNLGIGRGILLRTRRRAGAARGLCGAYTSRRNDGYPLAPLHIERIPQRIAENIKGIDQQQDGDTRY